MKRLPLYILSSLLLVSCSRDLQEVTYKDLVKMDIDKVESKDNHRLADSIKEHKYVKLETRKDCLIGEISKIILKKKFLYILDKRTRSIFKFTSDGRFISKIHNQGKGPGEYLSLSDFDIDDDGNLYLLDMSSKQVLVYEKDGNYLKTISSKYLVTNILSINKELLVNYVPFNVGSSTPEGHVLITRNGNVHKSWFPFSNFKDGKGGVVNLLKSYAFRRSENTILFNEDLRDTIYELKSDQTLTAKYTIDFGSKRISDDLRNRPTYFIGDPTLIQEGWHLENYFETSKYFTCSFNMEGKTWVLFFDRNKKTYQISSCAALCNPKAKIISDMRVLGVLNDYFVSEVPGRFLSSNKEILNKYPDKSQNFTEENYKLICDYEPNSNPVLVFYKLK
jgi:hypothetical protein